MESWSTQLVESCAAEYAAAQAHVLRGAGTAELDIDYELLLTLFFAMHVDHESSVTEHEFLRAVTEQLGWSEAYRDLIFSKIERLRNYTYLDLRVFRQHPALAAVAYKLACGVALMDGELNDDEKVFLANLRVIFFGAEDSPAVLRLDQEITALADGSPQRIFAAFGRTAEQSTASNPISETAKHDENNKAKNNPAEAHTDTENENIDTPAENIEEKNPPATVAECMAELDALIGLDAVKREVRQLISFLEIQTRRTAHDLPTSALSLHMIFTGNPGTGKTTVARIVARIYQALGFLAEGHLVETDRAGLVAQYVGHTEVKTAAVIDRARGGILFIDEAYSLNQGGENDFGQQAIDMLVKRMEDHRAELVVIVAGYSAEMDAFVQANPGLQSRFGSRVDFLDYVPIELLEIFRIFCTRHGYVLKHSSVAKLREVFQAAVAAVEPHFGNGRAVRNIFEQSLRRQAVRLSALSRPLTRHDLVTLKPSDIASM